MIAGPIIHGRCSSCGAVRTLDRNLLCGSCRP